VRDIDETITNVYTAARRLAQANKEVDDARRHLTDAIRHARASGLTLASIGKIMGVSRQRVHQMLSPS
jgi:DNA-directed RNA polymerase sigma subunit (sigma70/sigma32)